MAIATIQGKAMLRKIKNKATLLKTECLLLSAVLLASCDGTVYNRFGAVDSSSWSQRDTLSFVYEGTGKSAGAHLNLEVQVRYNSGYRYKNLNLRVETERLSDSTLLSVDTLCCRVFDDAGRRLGSTAGAIYQGSCGSVGIAASPADTLLLRVSHIMADSCLSGVCDVGVRLATAK